MSPHILQRYLWFFDTVWRYKRITRSDIERLWMQSDLSNGRSMTRRTFYNYREGAEIMFDVNIKCDPVTYEYYIEPIDVESTRDLQQWLFDTLSVNYVARHSADMSQRILPDKIPSGNDYLSVIVGAMKECRVMRVGYHAFWKMEPQEVLLEPYFVKSFRKRWYVVGYNRIDGQVKTYALDRIVDIALSTEPYEMPAEFVPKEYFAHAFGVMRGERVEDIRLRVTPRQAQYLRALPLHESQQECEVADHYVDFTYRMYVTYDLVQELMSLGREVEVIAPQSLREELRNKLQAAVELYK